MPAPDILKSVLPALGSALLGVGVAVWVLPLPDSGLAASERRATGGLDAGNLLDRPSSGTAQAQLDFLRKAGNPTAQMAAALRFASLSSLEEIRGLLDLAPGFPANAAGTLAVEVLLKRWVGLDPAGALEYCRVHFPKSLPKLIGTWSQTDPAKAEAFILTLPGGYAKTEAWTQLCAATATRDPAKAWELLGRFPIASRSSVMDEAGNLVDQLTAQDLEGSIARLSSLPAALLATARESIARKLIETDPARGWTWVREQPNAIPLLSKTIEKTLDRDPAQALAGMAALSSEQRQLLLKYENSFFWGSRDPAALAAALDQNDGFSPEEKVALAGRFLNTALWNDPAKAEAFLPFFKGPILSREVDAYLNVRASNTSDSVIEAWMAALPAGEVRTAAETAWKRRQELPPLPPDLPTPASLVGLYRNGARVEADDPRISQLNAAQLGEMLAEAPEGKLRSSGNILTGLAKTNPAVAASWFATVPMDKTTAPRAAQFSATWAQEDPAAAAGWVASLPAGDLAVNAATNVARQYHRYAPQEAAAWAAQLPPGPVQEAARKVMEGK